MKGLQTAERSSAKDPSENSIFQRHMIAYEQASELARGQVLEVGSGEGYGLKLLAPKADEYVALDKFKTEIDLPEAERSKIKFLEQEVPPFTGLADNTFDFVVTFQVIEHIKKDNLFVQEIHRVLKPGGTLILTTPNRKMSLTRNPWHVREYLTEELRSLLSQHFASVEMKGVFGNEKVMSYYEKNKASVQKITRFDIFNLQYLLPRQLLQIPYDILNRINRRKLLEGNTNLVQDITSSDYFIDPVSDSCLDFFCLATK